MSGEIDTKEKFTSIMEKFIALAAIRLSDDVMSRLREMREHEDTPLQKAIYDSYLENLKMALEFKRPCCQDTGLLQFYIKAGTAFPHLDITAEALVEATGIVVHLRDNYGSSFPLLRRYCTLGKRRV